MPEKPLPAESLLPEAELAGQRQGIRRDTQDDAPHCHSSWGGKVCAVCHEPTEVCGRAGGRKSHGESDRECELSPMKLLTLLQEEPLDESSVKKMILTFEKRSYKNQELRIKFPDNPEK